MTRDAIDGFGRIGRLAGRAILERPESGLELAGVSDLAEPYANDWLLKQDGFRGAYPGEVIADGASETMDAFETAVIEEKPVRVLSWYDHEWDFSNRMVDKAATMARQA